METQKKDRRGRPGTKAAVRIAAILLAVILLAALPAGCARTASGSGKAGLTDLEVTFLDVGKADCIVIRNEGCVTLIDTGEEDTAAEVLSFLEEEGIDTVDMLILSHFDKDHVGGAAAIIENLDVKAVYTTAYIAKESDEIDAYLAAAEEKGLDPVMVDTVTSLSVGSAEFVLIPPGKEEYDKDTSNNSSLAAHMTYGEISFLFTGDVQEERIDELLAGDVSLDCDVIKMPHHGGWEDNLEELLDAASPGIAVITCSDDEKEEEDTADLLDRIGTETFLTREGAVTVVSDGAEISAGQERILLKDEEE